MSDAAAVKPFPKLSEVFIAHPVSGDGTLIGERVLVTSVINQGTKRRPEYRYAVRTHSLGTLFLDHGRLSATDPLAGDL